MSDLDSYQRLFFGTVPIYLNAGEPDWFIPTKKADFIISRLKERKSVPEAVAEYNRRLAVNGEVTAYQVRAFLARIKSRSGPEYNGREDTKKLDSLRECWFHITNNCNMACRHCMFCSGPTSKQSLPLTGLTICIKDVTELGCKVFYFTGGEPFVYQGFPEVCNSILESRDRHVVILTNGKNLSEFDGWLKAAPRGQVHFQLSIDGLEGNHEFLRGKGSFTQLLNSLEYLAQLGFPATLAMAVNAGNVHEMAAVTELAAGYGVGNVHYLWLFRKGNADGDLFVEPDIIFPQLAAAYEQARAEGVKIDNFEILKSQIFSLPGTKFDLSNAGWESLCVGPDGNVYPSPALVYEKNLAAGHISDGIEEVWKNSPVLKRIRSASLLQSEKTANEPLKYLIGGGDLDHSYIAAQTFAGDDPYLQLYAEMVKYLLAKEATPHLGSDGIGMICRMGERLYECNETSSALQFTHSNCVLSLPGSDGHSLVKSYYSEAAEDVNEDIVNPVSYGEQEVSHIPVEARVRSYGCGSPVLDCELREGEVLVDLGSGTGVECFIAARHVGNKGRVFGIDMADTMLALARRNGAAVAEKLGYDNLEFLKGYLESIPLEPDTADVVISNCVINLSPDKRRTFREIRRILKPGGRLVISDIVSSDEIPIDIKYNNKLRGECIGGAMLERELFAMLAELSFENIYVLKRFLYRQVAGYDFFSVTYRAGKPVESVRKEVIYRGPFAGVLTDGGAVLPRGERSYVELPSGLSLDESSFFVLDESGNVVNTTQDMKCACFAPPAEQATGQATGVSGKKFSSGCMVCGAELRYLERDETRKCLYCGEAFKANAVCLNGHYVCDKCHSQDALEIIRRLCIHSKEKDMLALYKKIKSHDSIPMHGPEHHSLVPAVILAVYRNTGGDITDDDVESGIERGATITGGACSFLGICGAAVGVGIAYSIILRANPYLGAERKAVQQITERVLSKIAELQAPRCCQRECVIALRAAADISSEYLPIKLAADDEFRCTISAANKECIGRDCPVGGSGAAAK